MHNCHSAVLGLGICTCWLAASCTPGTAATRQSGPLFAEVFDAPPVLDIGPSRGVAWGDVDGDGDADLFVARSSGHRSMLYRNDSARLVALVNSPVSVDNGDSEGAAWVDLDGDGDLDLYGVTRSERPSQLFMNDGSGGLVPRSDSVLTSPRRASMACFADTDRDSDLDVFIAGYRGSSNVLAQNDGAGTFTTLSLPDAAVGSGEARTCAWGDVDDDGFPDLFIGNALGANVLVRNEMGVRFTEWHVEYFSTDVAYTYGASWADFDQDGDVDLFVANFDSDNLLYENTNGMLRPVPAAATPQSAASKGHTWGDFDLDGTLDLYLGSGTPSSNMVNVLYLGDGTGGFDRVDGEAWLERADTSAGVAAADYDRDGDLDIFVANWGSARSQDRLYQAQVTGRSWLAVELRGTTSNSHGIGARVSVLANVFGQRRWQHRRVSGSTGYAGQDDAIVHFGLGDASGVDSLVVLWPSGVIEQFGEHAAGQRWILHEH